MRDIKDMQFINHIFSKHRIPAALIVASVFMLVVHFVSTSLAATPYAPSATLNPAEGPGDAFVEIPTSQWEDSGSNIFYDGGDAYILGNTDGAVQFYVENDSSGTSASSDLFLLNDGGLSGFLSARSSTYSLFSSEQANRFVLSSYVSSTGLSLVGFKSSDDIRFYTGGAAAANERMRILSTGNVGIGTTSPSQALEIYGNNAAIQLTATNSPMAGIARYRLKTTDGSSVDHIWDIANDQPTGDLIFNEFTGTGASVQFNSLVKTPNGLVIQSCDNEAGTPCDGSTYQDGQIWIDTTP